MFGSRYSKLGINAFMLHAHLYMILAIVFGFFMAWGVGANDVANAMGTSVGSKAITLTQAIIIAAIFEVAGAMLAGGQVTDTIRSHIIDVKLLTGHPELMIYGMLASLLAAGSWLLLATKYGWPVSTTHSIVGAIVGFAVLVLGPKHVNWAVFLNIAMSWVLTPIIAGIIAFFLFRSVQVLIFNSETPMASAKRYIPFYIFLVALVLSLVTLFLGLKHVKLPLSNFERVSISVGFSVLISLVGAFFLSKVSRDHDGESQVHVRSLEKIFTILMVFTACALAFAHGSNDVANAIGPLASVVQIVGTGIAVPSHQSPIPLWVMGLGAVGIVTGLGMYGYKVMATVGSGITQLTPSRGFAAQFATATTVVVASGFGLPISTTQTLVGAVLGVGIARGMGAINLDIVRNIFLSWVITLPAGAFFSMIYFYLLKWIFFLIFLFHESRCFNAA